MPYRQFRPLLLQNLKKKSENWCGFFFVAIDNILEWKKSTYYCWLIIKFFSEWWSSLRFGQFEAFVLRASWYGIMSVAICILRIAKSQHLFATIFAVHIQRWVMWEKVFSTGENSPRNFLDAPGHFRLDGNYMIYTSPLCEPSTRSLLPKYLRPDLNLTGLGFCT